jgi:hypothetical protein
MHKPMVVAGVVGKAPAVEDIRQEDPEEARGPWDTGRL